MGFFLLVVITLNLEHGLGRDRARKNEIQAAFALIFQRRKPQDVPLFLATVNDIAFDLESADIVQFPREQPLEDEVWSWLKDRMAKGSIGRRASLCRYHGSQAVATKSKGF